MSISSTGLYGVKVSEIFVDIIIFGMCTNVQTSKSAINTINTSYLLQDISYLSV